MFKGCIYKNEAYFSSVINKSIYSDRHTEGGGKHAPWIVQILLLDKR